MVGKRGYIELNVKLQLLLMKDVTMHAAYASAIEDWSEDSEGELSNTTCKVYIPDAYDLVCKLLTTLDSQL